MATPLIEVPAGAIDGVNKVFTVSLPYQSGTTAVFLNGVLQRIDFDDGWVETSPATGAVTLNEAPVLLDTVQVYYVPGTGTGAGTEEVVEGLTGTLVTTGDLLGSILASGDLQGTITDRSDVLAGAITAEQPLLGVVADVDNLTGSVEVDCG